MMDTSIICPLAQHIHRFINTGGSGMKKLSTVQHHGAPLFTAVAICLALWLGFLLCLGAQTFALFHYIMQAAAIWAEHPFSADVLLNQQHMESQFHHQLAWFQNGLIIAWSWQALMMIWAALLGDDLKKNHFYFSLILFVGSVWIGIDSIFHWGVAHLFGLSVSLFLAMMIWIWLAMGNHGMCLPPIYRFRRIRPWVIGALSLVICQAVLGTWVAIDQSALCQHWSGCQHLWPFLSLSTLFPSHSYIPLRLSLNESRLYEYLAAVTIVYCAIFVMIIMSKNSFQPLRRWSVGIIILTVGQLIFSVWPNIVTYLPWSTLSIQLGLLMLLVILLIAMTHRVFIREPITGLFHA